MELTFKQKAAVFGVMLAIFICSVFAKQWIDGKSIEKAETSGETVTVQSSSDNDESVKTEKAEKTEAAEGTEIVLDVEGAVTYPGIVKVKEGSRVYEAVEKAGGVLETADTKYVNLAEAVSDGSVIYIPFKGENAENTAGEQGAEGAGAPGTGAGSDTSGQSGLININTADKATLMTLSGIGEVYAQAIIDYRTQNGSFKSNEDIKNVSGIGDATYEKLKDKICTY